MFNKSVLSWVGVLEAPSGSGKAILFGVMLIDSEKTWMCRSMRGGKTYTSHYDFALFSSLYLWTVVEICSATQHL